MISYDKQQIQRAALTGTVLNFLRSEGVAQAVAGRVVAYLKAHGVKSPDDMVDVERSRRRPGTWAVRITLPPPYRWHDDLRRAAQEANAAEHKRAVDALRASYKPSDLVDRWTAPSRRR